MQKNKSENNYTKSEKKKIVASETQRGFGGDEHLKPYRP
jgi:hypothetical protein